MILKHGKIVRKIKIPLDEFIKQLQKIQADMATVKHQSYANTISFCLHTSDDVERLNLVEDEYDCAIEYDYHMGCRCTLGANINLMQE